MAAASDILARSRRVARHLRHPRSVPALLRTNVNQLRSSIRLAFASRRPGYWNELGSRFAARGHHAEALACYDRALSIRDDIPRAWADRGTALRELDHLAEAETSLRTALRLQPDFADAHYELGSVLDYLGRFDEAEASLRTALRLEPENVVVQYKLGRILCHLGRAREAQASFRTVLRQRPDIITSHWALGVALLMAGELQEGWDEFEWRWKVDHMVPPCPMPSWNGEAIGDRTIWLFADQGLGDALQFSRFVPQVAASAGKTILAVHPPLMRLLSRVPGVSEVIGQRELPASCDLWCGFMSLPRAFRTTTETIPRTPYLDADPADVARWRDRLAGLTGPRVGLCWAGSRSDRVSKIAEDRRRSFALESLAPFGGISGVHFISLQKGRGEDEAARPPPGMELHDFTADLHDFADTAALIENLDLVISVDTSIAHLAGALDKPVWVLNRFDTDWRWPRDRDDSPWYPSARQFRQPAPGDWTPAISAARDALKKLAAGERGELRPSSASQARADT